jgi:hypothetical protein
MLLGIIFLLHTTVWNVAGCIGCAARSTPYTFIAKVDISRAFSPKNVPANPYIHFSLSVLYVFARNHTRTAQP